MLLLEGQYGAAVEQARRAITDNPSSSSAQLHLAVVYGWRGEFEKCLELIEGTLRLSPGSAFGGLRQGSLGIVYYFMGDGDRALNYLPSLAHSKIFGPAGPVFLAAAHVRVGKHAEASKFVNDVQSKWPGVTQARIRACWQTMWPASLEMLREDLTTAGLPEGSPNH